eukprot:scaffold96187_cov20-Tisochrysis_lutea.AAC.1
MTALCLQQSEAGARMRLAVYTGHCYIDLYACKGCLAQRPAIALGHKPHQCPSQQHTLEILGYVSALGLMLAPVPSNLPTTPALRLMACSIVQRFTQRCPTPSTPAKNSHAEHIAVHITSLPVPPLPTTMGCKGES